MKVSFNIILLLQVSALKQGFVPITPEGIAVSIGAKSVYDIKICFIFLLVNITLCNKQFS